MQFISAIPAAQLVGFLIPEKLRLFFKGSTQKIKQTNNYHMKNPTKTKKKIQFFLKNFDRILV